VLKRVEDGVEEGWTGRRPEEERRECRRVPRREPARKARAVPAGRVRWSQQAEGSDKRYACTACGGGSQV